MKRLMIVLALVAGAVQAGEWAGNYVWSGGEPERVGMERAVAKSADSASLLIRPIVRRKLAGVIAPFTNITFAVSNGTVRFQRDGSRSPVVAALGGEAVTWTRDDGRVFQARYRMEGDALQQVFSNEDGSRVNAFRLLPDGKTLTMSVTVTSDSFKTPVAYVQTFVRAASPP